MTDPKKKPEKSYKSGNVDEDGSYKVGKGRPPEHGKFRKGDGRKRGRRAKGTQNLATDFEKERNHYVSVQVDGKARRVTKQQAVIMRLFDKASRGETPAIRSVMEYAEKFETSNNESEDEYDLSRLNEEEMDLFGQLLCKMAGVEPGTVGLD
ncbi:DUF5681 domain-containing protein [Erythrobacter sp. W53]|uniref:DUF5681 domain-containing protein n=1 Tax=Erythrobacter sp. W53 TaxID=3425947 RepID=UPI003D7690D2